MSFFPNGIHRQEGSGPNLRHDGVMEVSPRYLTVPIITVALLVRRYTTFRVNQNPPIHESLCTLDTIPEVVEGPNGQKDSYSILVLVTERLV